jgi:hypothetical protein
VSDLKILEEKINHIDKTVLGIETTVKHFSEKLAETVKINSRELNNHDNRITGLERTFHTYDGSIKTLNRLISLGGVFVFSGVIWLFTQMNENKRDYALIQSKQQQMMKELDTIRQDVERMKYDRTIKSTDTDQYN